jgi:prepilin-type N-terminal cleavage/methylation domain-containing protein
MKTHGCQHKQHRAFTLVELLVVITVVSIMAALLLPALAVAQRKAGRANCLSNLKQIGVGFRLFGNDNSDKFPWAVSVVGGGSFNSSDWTDHYRVCSNEMNTPKILVCPADKERTVAKRWDLLDGARNISFFVGLDADERRPETILAGDRNVYSGNGASDQDLSWNREMGTSIDAFWLAKMHIASGNLMLSDGSVQQTSTPSLRGFITAAVAGSTNVIFSLPRGVL